MFRTELEFVISTSLNNMKVRFWTAGLTTCTMAIRVWNPAGSKQQTLVFWMWNPSSRTERVSGIGGRCLTFELTLLSFESRGISGIGWTLNLCWKNKPLQLVPVKQPVTHVDFHKFHNPCRWSVQREKFFYVTEYRWIIWFNYF